MLRNWIACLLLLTAASTPAHASEFDNFFLGFVDAKNPSHVSVYVRAGSHLSPGTRLFLVSPTTFSLSGSVQVLRPHNSEDFGTTDEDLQVAEAMFPADVSALVTKGRALLFAGKNFDHRRVGTVKQVALPQGESPMDAGAWQIESEAEVILPTGKHCSFEEAEKWDDPKQTGVVQSTFGRGALRCPGSTIVEEAKPSTPFLEREWLQSIISVSNLTNHSKFEILVVVGGMYHWRYELRDFDGARFGSRREVLLTGED